MIDGFRALAKQRRKKVLFQVLAQPPEWVEEARQLEAPLIYSGEFMSVVVDKDMGLIEPCDKYPRGAICLRGRKPIQWFEQHAFESASEDGAEILVMQINNTLREFEAANPWADIVRKRKE